MTRSQRPTRRDVLSGRAVREALAAAAVRQAGPVARGKTPDGRGGRGGCLLQFARRAMACQFEIFLPPSPPPGAAEAALAALDLVEQLEEQLSVFRPESELSRLNRRAARTPVVVSPGLFGLLERAAALSRMTDGAFDVTAGPLAKVWGFHRRRGRMPSDEALEAALHRVGFAQLELDDRRRSVRFLAPDMEINLGAIGKGYALDRCAELLEEAEVGDYLIHGGQSSVLARGVPPSGGEDRSGWTIAVAHPLRPGRRLAELELRDEALGTSGSARQFFYHQGRRYSHVLDPRTGRPAEGVLSATVLAPTAAEADALATAAFVLGVERTGALIDSRPELAALLATPGRRGGAVELHALNLPADRWRRLDEAA